MELTDYRKENNKARKFKLHKPEKKVAVSNLCEELLPTASPEKPPSSNNLSKKVIVEINFIKEMMGKKGITEVEKEHLSNKAIAILNQNLKYIELNKLTGDIMNEITILIFNKFNAVGIELEKENTKDYSNRIIHFSCNSEENPFRFKINLSASKKAPSNGKTEEEEQDRPFHKETEIEEILKFFK